MSECDARCVVEERETLPPGQLLAAVGDVNVCRLVVLFGVFINCFNSTENKRKDHDAKSLVANAVSEMCTTKGGSTVSSANWGCLTESDGERMMVIWIINLLLESAVASAGGRGFESIFITGDTNSKEYMVLIKLG